MSELTLRSPHDLPKLTDLSGTAGVLVDPEDFRVEEIPAYLPTGEGEHVYLLIEKRRLTTPQAIQRLCSHFNVSSRDAGYAGLKDREAVTQQWISLPGADLGLVASFEDEQLRVLDVSRHTNKLRTGHLRGNRFTLVLHNVVEDALSRAEAVLERIAEVGLPNFYGPQRFGREGDNARVGLAALHGEGKLPRDRQRRRLIISAAQSQIFNEDVAERLESGTLVRLRGGEVLQRLDSGGIFVSEDATVDQPRLDTREVVITGPMCGPRMTRALEGSPAALFEQQIFDRLGVVPDAFSRFGRLARGGRRPVVVHPADVRVDKDIDAEGADQLTLRFSLPAGSYATVLLREVCKGAFA
ncbi:MAG: tRNA pseudouridine(13) synthase TruD [Deltaproteobacteria bacterium]|nr:tRNA pseudouridine(13) synthase TruD [Deltaproteobacteria bacterium]